MLNSSISISYVNPIDSASDQLIVTGYDFSIGTPLSHNTQVDLQNIMAAPMVPLIVDPDGIIVNYLKKSMKISVVSIYSLAFELAILKAIIEGSTLILSGVNSLHPILSTILSKAKEIIIEGVTHKISETFRLFLTTMTLEIEQLSANLLSSVTIIKQIASNIHAVHNVIVHRFVDHFDSDLLPRVIHSTHSLKYVKRFGLFCLFTFRKQSI